MRQKGLAKRASGLRGSRFSGLSVSPTGTPKAELHRRPGTGPLDSDGNPTIDVRQSNTRRLRPKTFVLLSLLIVLGPTSNVLLRMGMRSVGGLGAFAPMALARYGYSVMSNGYVWLGTLGRILFTVLYMLVLSWADYSFITPASSLAYAVVVLLGYLVLGETVTLERCAGVALICIGVALVGATPPRTTEPEGRSFSSP